jgi:glycosyltransferase involved in cell wall biosynthesis
LPPPVHGASIVGKYIQSSTLINQQFCTHFINLATATKLTDSGNGGIKKIVGLLKIQLKIISALLHRKYDLCYVTLNSSGPAFYKELLIVTLLKVFRQKLIYHFHNKGVTRNNKNKINHLLYRFVFKNSRCIVLSPKLIYDIQPYVDSKNVFYCVNGISAIEDKIANMPLRKKSHVCSLLFLSNMLVEKGVLVLLDGCRLLKEKGLSFTCHFVGGWGDISEETFNSIVKKSNLSDVVRAHGPKYNQEKSQFYTNADIFILPTFYRNEVFPLVLLEAMQHGIAIVSTPEGGIPDIVIEEQTGFLVPQRDVQALAKKIELLILNPELREKMGIEGKKRFENLFTIEKFEKNFAGILKKAVSM